MSYGMNSSFRGTTGISSGQAGTGREVIPKGFQKGQLNQFTPEQMQLFQQMFSHLGPESFLSRLAGGDQSGFEQMEEPALKQFAGLQGNIASRFSGMGSGAQRSSGFQHAMNSAASDFAQQLQSQRMGLQRSALQDLMGMSQQLLGQRPQEQFLTEKPMSFGKQLALGTIPAIAQGATSFALGKWGV